MLDVEAPALIAGLCPWPNHVPGLIAEADNGTQHDLAFPRGLENLADVVAAPADLEPPASSFAAIELERNEIAPAPVIHFSPRVFRWIAKKWPVTSS